MNYNRTEESLFTLISLFILIEQNFESLTGSENILYADFDSQASNFSDLVNDTIREALVYQILLRTCSYLDEWNKVFGVSTEPEDKEKIILAKQFAKPAYKCISEWNQLRDFRNQAIAHNHRDQNGKNIYLNRRKYNCPQSNRDIYLLVFCIQRMSECLKFFFSEVFIRIVNGLALDKSSQEIDISKKELEFKMKSIDGHLDKMMKDYNRV